MRRRRARPPDRPVESPRDMPLAETDWESYGIREARLDLIKRRHMALRGKRFGKPRPKVES